MKKSIKKFVAKELKNSKEVKGGANGRGTRAASGNTSSTQTTKLL